MSTGNDTPHAPWERRIDRRLFLRTLSMASAGLAVAPVVAACQSSTTTTPSTTGAWAAAPVTFVYADVNEPAHLDPAFGTLFDEYSITRNVYDPLVDTDETTLKLVPRLAASWESSSDALTHTFHLRPGVVFHDGSSLDAETVKLSLDRQVAIQQGPAYLIANIKSVDTPDTMTVRVNMQTPDAYLPEHLVKIAILSGQALKSNRTASDPWATRFFAENAIGSGPYKFVSWQKGVQITLAKNARWWGPSWLPGSIDTVIIKPTADSSARADLLSGGEADFAEALTVQQTIQLGGSKGFRLLQWKTFDTDPIIYLNTTKPPFDRVEVRRAMQAAFDYKAMVDYYKGYAVTPTGPIPPDYPGGASDLKPFTQDLNKAKSLLQQAGIDLASFRPDFISITDAPEFPASSQILQSALKQIGVDMAIRTMPFTQDMQAYANPSTAGQLTHLAQSPFTLDPIQFLSFYLPNNLFNFAKYDNPSVTRAIEQLPQTTDAAQRAKMLHDVQHTVRDDAPCVWCVRPKTLIPLRDYIDGYVMQATDFRFSMRFQPMRIQAH